MIKNIIHTLFTKGIVAVINLIILIVSAKYLGLNTSGEIGIFVFTIATIQIVNEIYSGYSLVYFVTKFDLNKIVVHGLVWIIAVTGILNLTLFLLNKAIPAFNEEIAGYGLHLFFLSLLIICNTFNLVILLAR